MLIGIKRICKVAIKAPSLKVLRIAAGVPKTCQKAERASSMA